MPFMKGHGCRRDKMGYKCHVGWDGQKRGIEAGATQCGAAEAKLFKSNDVSCTLVTNCRISITELDLGEPILSTHS